MEKVLRFAIDQIKLIELSDSQNAIAEVRVCHTGMNAHRLPISLQSLQEASATIANKWLVAGWDGKDFEGHEDDQRIIGFFPKENNFRYIEENGKTYFIANAVISKLYAPWAFEVFEKDNFRECSMEITILETEYKDGFEWIKSFIYNAVTILGTKFKAACQGSNVVLAKFSEEELINIREELSKNFNKEKEVEQVNFDKVKFAETLGATANEMWEALINSTEIKPEEIITFAKEVVSVEFAELQSENDIAKEKMADLENKLAEMEQKFSTLEAEKEELVTKFSEVEVLKAENATLLEFKANVEETERKNKIEFAINSVSEDLTPEQVEEWRNKSVDFSTVEEFGNAIKAFAYENSKGKKKDNDVITMSIPINPIDDKKTKSLWERI